MKAAWLLALLMMIGLTGCGQSVESLAEDDEARNQILKECADMGEPSQRDELCKMAARAQVEAAKRSIKGVFE